MRRAAAVLLGLALVGAACTKGVAREPITIGAIYPLSGPEAPGGVDEHRGILLAADLANATGGVDGHPIRISSVDVAGADAAAAAVDELDDAGIQLVMGSYSSTISSPASAEAARRGMLFWETGAVGMLPPSAEPGTSTFRVPPTGAVLGRAAIDFIVNRLAPRLDRNPAHLRFAVSYVDDVYGRSVAGGAEQELRARGLRDVGNFGYDFHTVDMAKLVRSIAEARPDVLFVSAYLHDAIDLRRQLIRQRVPLLANIGTSSSYCMPQFGETLGWQAVGVYASDKPTASSINPTALRPSARSLLRRANDAYRARWGTGMSAAALAGFSAAWAFFNDVLPRATSFTPTAVAAAARTVDLPRGSLPNGSGLRFGAAGTTTAGDNVQAASVIWEWVSPGKAAVIWPPAFATRPMDPGATGLW